MSVTPVKREKLKVILDSNVFFIPLKFKIDIFEELTKLLNRNLEYILLFPVKQELEVLASDHKSKIGRNASYALKIAQKCKLVAVKTSCENTDDIIVQVAKSWDVPVFTNDRPLKMRLRDISVPVIYLRQKSRLDVDGLIP